MSGPLLNNRFVRVRKERDLQLVTARRKLRVPQKRNLKTAGNTVANTSEIILNNTDGNFYGHNGIQWSLLSLAPQPPQPPETLAETLAAGNTTSTAITGQNIILDTAVGIDSLITSAIGTPLSLAAGAVNSTVSSADDDIILAAGGVDASLVGAGDGIIALQSDSNMANAIDIVASNVAGGVRIGSGTFGTSIDSVGGVIELSTDSTDTGAIFLQVTGATGSIDLDAGSSGAVTIDAGDTSNFSTTSGTLTLETNGVGAADQVVINSGGTGVSAIDINATAGGITIDYAAANILPVTSGGTPIATFGTSAAPDLTLNSGDLVFSIATQGIKNGPTNGVVNAFAVTTNGTVGVIQDQTVLGGGGFRV